MIVEQMHCYFMYNVPIVEQLLNDSADLSLATPTALLDSLGTTYPLAQARVPAFFTEHYRQAHAPWLLIDPAGPAATVMRVDRFKAVPHLANLPLTQDLPIEWEFEIAPQGIGLITIRLAVDQPLAHTDAQRLVGLYLNPAFDVIDTTPVAYLWQHNPAERPAYATLDQLAEAIHRHFFQGVAPVRRYRSLRHEIQSPLISVLVSTAAPNQRAFVEENRVALAELLFRPAAWEVAAVSQQHIDDIMHGTGMWSVAEDAVAWAAYEGMLLVRIREFQADGLDEVSGFYLTAERSVLATYKVAAASYHFMRIVDDLLEGEMASIAARVRGYQETMRQLIDPSPLSAKRDALLEIDTLVVQIISLQFALHNLLEEIRNPDKLLDDASHIVLLEKANSALLTRGWCEAIERKVEEMWRMLASIERMRETLVGLGMNESLIETNRLMVETNEDNLEMQNALEKLQLLFVALAVIQFLQIVADVWFDGFHGLTLWLDISLFGKPEARAGALLITLVVFLVTLLSVAATTWLLNAIKKRSRRRRPSVAQDQAPQAG